MQEGQGGEIQPPEHDRSFSAPPAEHEPPGQDPQWAPPPPPPPPPGTTIPEWAPPPGQAPWAPPPGPALHWASPPGAGQPGDPGQPPGAGQPPFWGPPPGGGYGGPPGGYAQPGGYGPPPRRSRLRARALIYALVAVLAAGAGAATAALVMSGQGTPRPGGLAGIAPSQVPQPGQNSAGAPAGINEQAVAGKVQPGVVDITARLHYTGQVFEGTGMVLSSSGLVLTNNHVVEGSTHLTATLVNSGRNYTAVVVGTDKADDVALLKLVDASGLATVQVGNSARVALGTPVVAIGNAGGRGGQPTVTRGAITALHQTITATDAGSNTSETLYGMLQTNAPIAEGDSGGPLSNAAGQVIGMDTAANTQQLGGPGTDQGFAIPIDRALSIARSIAAGQASGTIRIGLPAFLGVEVYGSGSPLKQYQSLQQAAGDSAVNSSRSCLPNSLATPVPSQIAPAGSGTLIAGVFCRAPAAGVGLQAGDVITAVNGRPVTAPASLTRILSAFRPGQSVSVTWTAVNGQQHTTRLTLIAGPAK